MLGDGRRLALQHRLLEPAAALRSWQSRWGKHPGAYVWTLSKNFTGMPMSAGEWHAWPAVPKVETRGTAWQRDGCAALQNLKRPRVGQRSPPLTAGMHPVLRLRQSVRGNDAKGWGIDLIKLFRVTPRPLVVTPEEGAKAPKCIPTRAHRASSCASDLAATTTGQAATISANRSLIWSGGCARCALDTTSGSQRHSASELRLHVGNDLLVYHPLCFAQRGCATSTQQDHAQRDYPLRLCPQAGGSKPCSPGISQANCLRLIKTGRHAT
jgi:hypothetical protein